MVKITQVYTRQGDKGDTHLAAGLRVKKNSARIQAIGSVDELNSFLGWLLESLRGDVSLSELFEQGQRIQNELFNLGSQLAVLKEYRRDNTPVVTERDVERLENEIDAANNHLPILTSFILPGGGEVSARFHIARSVCRRAERDLFGLAEAEGIESVVLAYVNRLSDWLFVMARFVADQPETLWCPERAP